MDLSAFTGFISSVQAVGQLAKASVEIRDAMKLQQVQLELGERINRLLAEAAQFQTAHVQLLQDKAQAHDRIRELQERIDAMGSYELQQTAAGTLLYAKKASDGDQQPAHYVCPRCWDVDGKKSILQPAQVGDARGLRCPACNTGFATEPPGPRPPRAHRISRGIGEF